jgi:hypothetical protein
VLANVICGEFRKFLLYTLQKLAIFTRLCKGLTWSTWAGIEFHALWTNREPLF